MATKIEICNSALISLGANTINSFNEESTESIACNAKWDIALKSTLRDGTWNFAIKRSTKLARTTTTPEFKYKYQYTIPTDCLRVLKVYNDGDYRLEGRNIITNAEDCFIKYIAYEQDTAKWDAMFTDLMVVRMAYELAYALPRTGSMIDRYSNLYKQKLIEAQSVDQTEDISDNLGQFESSLISVRRYG